MQGDAEGCAGAGAAMASDGADVPHVTDTMVSEEKELAEVGEQQYEKEKQARIDEVGSCAGGTWVYIYMNMHTPT